VDVLLVTVDCLRASAIGRGDTPTLDALAARGVVFENAVAQSSWTSPALFSLFSGCTPAAHGVTARGGRLSARLRALPQLFRSAGANVPNVCYLNDEESYAALGWGERQALESALPHGGFVWTHYERCHLPYSGGPPHLEPLRRAHVIPRGSIPLTPSDRPAVLEMYANGVRAMDTWLDRVLQKWSGPVVVTADHGEELLEHGWIGHTSTAEHPTLYQEVLRIPLIMYGFGMVGRVAERVGQIDVMPTLCELAGIPHGEVEGRSLVPRMRGESAVDAEVHAETGRAGYRTRSGDEPFRLRSLHLDRWKLIASTEGRTELYDLRADPEERLDMAEAHPERVAAMLGRSVEHEAQARRFWESGRPAVAIAAARHGEGVRLEWAGEDRLEIEYASPASRGTLYAGGPSVEVTVDAPARFRACAMKGEGNAERWIEA
jgi:arylsulfatase A-like enzyme